MLKTFVTIALAIMLTTQTCDKGCLKCTTDGLCLFCDTTENYKLETNSCVAADQPNCAILALEGSCLVCDKNYYFSSVTSKCVAVETTNVITNCVVYNSAQVCISCDSNFYIDNGKCVAPTTLISNCQNYATSTTCSGCKEGYFIALNNKSCSALPGTANCSSFSRFTCQNCKSGYIKNRNLYFLSAFNLTSVAEKQAILQKVLNNKLGLKSLVNNAVCQPVTVTNCSELIDYKTCKVCSPGYFLQNALCVAYPIDIILQCLEYSTSTTCTQCNQGFYLSNNKCVSVTTVSNCSVYHQTLNECSQCNSDHYRQNTSTCTKRVQSLGTVIGSCSVKSTTQDRCQGCNTGFNLSSDGLKCFTNVSNCQTHNSVTSSATNTTCTKCIDGYYLQGTTCTAGTDVNCVTYQIGTGVCAVCKNGFYLSGNTCTAHINIANCQTYSQTTKNTCNFCENNTYNFSITKDCELRAQILNCKTYIHGDTTSTCDTCDEGFKKDGDNSCVSLTTANCALETSGVCTKCKEGFYLFKYTGTNGDVVECKHAHDLILDQCENVTGVGTNKISEVTCADCKKYAFTIDYENAYACVNKDYLKQEDIAIADAAQIEHCLKLDSDKKCDLCASGYYLKNDRLECLLSGCGSNGAAQTYEAVTVGDDGGGTLNYFVKHQNFCTSAQETNALVKAYNLQDMAKIILKCLDGKPAKVTIGSEQYSNVNPNGSFGNWIQDPMDVFPAVTCISTTYTINEGTTTLIDRCSYYYSYPTATTDLGCLRCNHGYSGKVSAKGYIVSCTTDSYCSQGVEYKNLDVYWTQLASCHKCTDSNKIPYVVGEGTAVGNHLFSKFEPYALATTDNWGDINNNERLVNTCLSNVSNTSLKTDLKITKLDADVVILANCGLGFLNLAYTAANFKSTDIANDGDTANQTILCGACLPGYKATTRTGGVTRIVTACTIIADCNTNSTWFNACSQCKSGKVYKYDSGLIKFDECIDYNKDANCYAADATECKICKKGYQLNRDNYCEKVNAPKCNDSKWIKFEKHPVDADLKYNLYTNSQGSGCNQCENGYIALKYQAAFYSQYACAQSAFVQTNVQNFPKQPDDTTSVFINYCESYVNKSTNVGGGGLVCKTCNPNYVLRGDGTECLSLNIVTNCKIAANSGNTCTECNTGYGLLTSGICELGNISNCKTYNVNDSAAVATCKICNSGYYLDANQCKAGAVAHCERYESNKYKCVDCATGYIKVSENQLGGLGNEDHNYCYPMDASLNCSAATIVNHVQLGGSFECTTCSQLYGKAVARSDAESKTQCLSYNTIDNCKTYHLLSTLVSTTLYCTECNTGYYYQDLGSKCIKRLVLPSACKLYVLGEDKCAECNAGNYIMNVGKECKTYPTGIIGCRIYSDVSTCTACDSDKYLDGNACTDVVTKIDKCMYYSSATTCSQCISTAFLSNNVCTTVVVNNCAVLAAHNVCQTCLGGNILVTENGVTTCKPHTVANCAIFEQSGTFPCTRCLQHYYVDATGKCVNSVIPNCLINESKDTCQLCEESHALSADKKTCVDKGAYDSQCKEQITPTSLDCSVCAPGYYFKDNVCTAFTQNSISDGCFSSTPFDNTVCYLCNTGYYMKSSQACQQITTTTPTTPSGSSLIKMFTLLFAVMLILQQNYY